MKNTYEIIIVGASIAGCSAALMYAEKGIRVLIIDKATSMECYKKHCVHFVQPCGIPILKRLNIYKDIDQLGLVTKARFWTGAGWVTSKENYYTNEDYAINLERSKFDPYIKKLVDNHPLIDLKLNANVTSVTVNNDQYKVTYTQNKETFSERAQLAIAADGRFSKVANLTDNQDVIYPNDRFVSFAYYKDLEIANLNFSDGWILGETNGFIYPLLDGYSLIAFYIHDAEKQKWKQNPEQEFNNLVNSLPDGPNIQKATRLTSFIGMNDIRTFYRAPLHAEIPFIGDATLSLDPSAGTGCSFALLSASWLVDYTSDVLEDKRKLKGALAEYSEKHTQWMAPHVKGITADSIVTKNVNSDNKFYEKIIESEMLTEAFLDLTGRLITPKEFQKIFFKETIEQRKKAV